ncbi:hypothetical protein Pint_24346 [Pistacia integerrima]|uniref:Uncharacterized protein n=1 Tax=Pistacia integerrima TaxID=434235 RepID=A0ACC0YFD8_9ROSI|nr:hypothetical protein Pint_24346 [Pistacia integerrima]
MNTMYSIMEPHLYCSNLWQLDGRPMSGDIGRGATRESVAFAVLLAAAKDRPPGFLQLAGGTNAHTVDGLKKEGLFQTTSTTKNSGKEKLTAISPSTSQSLIGGVAYGGYARKIVGRVLNSLQMQHGLSVIEDHPEHLLEALQEAIALVGTVKCFEFLFRIFQAKYDSNNSVELTVQAKHDSRQTPSKQFVTRLVGAARTQAPAATNYDVGSPTWGDLRVVHRPSAMMATTLGPGPS